MKLRQFRHMLYEMHLDVTIDIRCMLLMHDVAFSYWKNARLSNNFQSPRKVGVVSIIKMADLEQPLCLIFLAARCDRITW